MSCPASRGLNSVCVAAMAVLGLIATAYSQRIEWDPAMRRHLFNTKVFDGKWVGENETFEVVVRLKFVFPDPWDGLFVVGNMRVKNKALGTTRVYALDKAEAQELYREDGLFWVRGVSGFAEAEKDGNRLAKFALALDTQAETLQMKEAEPSFDYGKDGFWRCPGQPCWRSPITLTRE